MMWAMGYSYSKHLVSSISILGNGRIEYTTHNLLGGISKPESVLKSQITMSNHASLRKNDTYLLLRVEGKRFNLMVDRKKGKFHAIDEEVKGSSEMNDDVSMLEGQLMKFFNKDAVEPVAEAKHHLAINKPLQPLAIAARKKKYKRRHKR